MVFTALQPVGLYKLDLASPRIKSFKEPTELEGIISSIVELYNARIKETEYDFNPVPIQEEEWKKLSPRNFSIRWYLATRHVPKKGAAKALMALSGKSDLQLGTVTEHHLIFLYKQHVLETTAKKISQTVSYIFVLATGIAHNVINDFADFSFPVAMARRICEPIFLSTNKLPLTGAMLTTADRYRKKLPFRNSALESLGALVTGFTTELKEKTSLYQLAAFNKFVKEDEEGKPKNEPLQLMVGEMHLKFNQSFNLAQHVQICDQFIQIEHTPKAAPIDGVDPAFEYLDHIKRVPSTDKELIGFLNALLIGRVYEIYKEEKTHTVDFYHHHHEKYFEAFQFNLREKKKKKTLATWAVPPSAIEVIQVLRKHVQCDSVYSFGLKLKTELVFDFIKGKKKKTYPLVTFFKGEVLYQEKPYFCLNGTWCQVEGQYYSFVQSEFLAVMGEKGVFLSKGVPGYLPHAWVNNKDWFYFSMNDLSFTKQDEKSLKAYKKALLAAEFQCVNDKDVVHDVPLACGEQDGIPQEHFEVISRFLKKNSGKKITPDLLKPLGITKSEATSIIKTLKESRTFLVSHPKEKDKYSIRQNPDKFEEQLKKRIGKTVLEQLTTCWKRCANYREKEEGYNRNYLFSVHHPQGEPFGPDEGFLVFDQVYANSKEQKIELFDVAYYSPQETFLYHIKEEFGQKTRDACSQIRTAAAALHNAKKLAGNSDILDMIFDANIEQNTKAFFRQKVQEQLLSFGETKEDAKKHFLSIFKERQLTFVYAFLDSAKEERALENELQRKYYFEVEHFDSTACTEYRGKKSLISTGIFSKLKEEEYLDEQGRLTDKFINCKAESFTPIFLGDRKKNAKALYDILSTGLSQYRSFIAKKELLDTKIYIESLGFHFRICQIYRDGEPSASSNFAPCEVDLAPSNAPVVKLEDIFKFKGSIYKKEITVGNGACALHALMGEEGEEGFEFCADEEDSQQAAKQDFLDKIEEKWDDQNLQKKLRAFFESLFHEASHKNPPYEAKKIFSHFSLLEWEEEKKELISQLKKKKNERNSALWKHISALKLKDKKLIQYCQILCTYEDNWKALSPNDLLEKIKEKGVQTVLNGCWDVLCEEIEEGVLDKYGLTDLMQEVDNLNELVSNFAEQKIRDNFDEIFQIYKKSLLAPAFYMSDLELELAAILYNKKAILFGCNDAGDCLTEHYKLLNCDSVDEAEVVILNERHPVHYSRCSFLE